MNGCEKVFHTMKEKGMDLAVLLDPADIKYVLSLIHILMVVWGLGYKIEKI